MRNHPVMLRCYDRVIATGNACNLIKHDVMTICISAIVIYTNK